MKKTTLKVITIVLAIGLALTCFVGLAACNKDKNEPTPTQISNEELYNAAVRDAVFADEDEILPLINITKDSPDVIWDGDRVLMVFMHKYPSSYVAGTNMSLQWSNVWCVSAAEIYKWVKNNADATDWTLRLHQGLGMYTTKNYNSLTAVWVDANVLYRPAYVTDTTAKMANTLQKTGDEAFDDAFKVWFDENTIGSYFDGAYPWTRLGYTYDWADNGTEYGMSEFIIPQNTNVYVEYTYSVEEFVTFAKNA